jgi:Spy/CpxP family protein refolding chaperone
MNKNLLRAIAMLAVLVGGSMLYAQMSQGGGQPGPGPSAVPPSPEQRLQRMTQQLNLTEGQQQQIKPLLDNESQQMQALWQDSSLSQQDRGAKAQQIRQNTTDQIKPILNADQQKKFDEMQARRPRHNMQVNGTQASPPPQPQ